MKKWGFGKVGKTYDAWPKNDKGEPERPLFLQHVQGSQFEVDMVIALLEAYDIPVTCKYTNDGELGKVILGQPGAGTDLYVPESLLEDAQNIISADIVNNEIQE